MGLVAASMPKKRNRVRILFHGQSGTQGPLAVAVLSHIVIGI